MIYVAGPKHSKEILKDEVAWPILEDILPTKKNAKGEGTKSKGEVVLTKTGKSHDLMKDWRFEKSKLNAYFGTPSQSKLVLDFR